MLRNHAHWIRALAIVLVGACATGTASPVSTTPQAEPRWTVRVRSVRRLSFPAPHTTHGAVNLFCSGVLTANHCCQFMEKDIRREASPVCSASRVPREVLPERDMSFHRSGEDGRKV
uniref:Secreted protein n=1 Tax=Anopheles merus TaxID=30066 RepID=A0A182VH07_ANOME